MPHHWEEGREEESSIFYITGFMEWKIKVEGLLESTHVMALAAHQNGNLYQEELGIHHPGSLHVALLNHVWDSSKALGTQSRMVQTHECPCASCIGSDGADKHQTDGQLTSTTKNSIEWSGNTRKISLMYSRKAEIGRKWALAERE